MKPQTKRVADYLTRKGAITPRDAMKFGCWRLGARIWELRREHGFAIDRRMRTVRTRDGYTRVAEYVLSA
jgi:hypothetical protein